MKKKLTQAYIDKDKKVMDEIMNEDGSYYLNEEALSYYYKYGSTKKFKERVEVLDETISRYELAYRNNDPTYINQFTVDLKEQEIADNKNTIAELTKSLKYASKADKKAISEQISDYEKKNELNAEILPWLQYQAEHMIFPSYSDWRFSTIEEIIAQINLKYTEKVSKEDYNRDQYGVTYEQYLLNFEKDKSNIDDEILLRTYSLDNDIPLMRMTYSTRRIMEGIFWMISLVSVGILLIIAPIISREYSNGTIRLLLTQPKNRFKVFWSKYIASIIIAVVMLMIAFGVYYFMVIQLYGAEDLAYPVLSVVDGEIVSQMLMATIMPVFVKSCISLLFVISLAFFFTTVTKSTIMAVVFPMMIVVFSQTGFILMASAHYYDIASYSFLPYMNMWDLIRGDLYIYMDELSKFHVSVQYGMLLLGGLSILLFALSAWVFTKRDVKN